MGFRMAHGYDLCMGLLFIHSLDLHHWELCNLEKTMTIFFITLGALLLCGFLANRIKGL